MVPRGGIEHPSEAPILLTFMGPPPSRYQQPYQQISMARMTTRAAHNRVRERGSRARLGADPPMGLLKDNCGAGPQIRSLVGTIDIIEVRSHKPGGLIAFSSVYCLKKTLNVP